MPGDACIRESSEHLEQAQMHSRLEQDILQQHSPRSEWIQHRSRQKCPGEQSPPVTTPYLGLLRNSTSSSSSVCLQRDALESCSYIGQSADQVIVSFILACPAEACVPISHVCFLAALKANTDDQRLCCRHIWKLILPLGQPRMSMSCAISALPRLTWRRPYRSTRACMRP